MTRSLFGTSKCSVAYHYFAALHCEYVRLVRLYKGFFVYIATRADLGNVKKSQKKRFVSNAAKKGGKKFEFHLDTIGYLNSCSLPLKVEVGCCDRIVGIFCSAKKSIS